MNDVHPQSIWDDVSNRIGEDLRAVVCYEATDFERVLREDVRTEYSGSDLQAVVDRTIVTQLSLDRDTGAFRAGEFSGFVRAFDDAWFLSVPDPADPKAGILVSVDRGSDELIDGDLEWCLDYLEKRVPTSSP
ncbi:hypothetical protein CHINAEXTREME_09680 [Halobiforma lacisalsi AJ5]|uniref:Uncharacterized protein n=1 Tax=Natronobacterium lacisalsi AJ5 TaxID=358396 RepID=M0L4V8_NATLA|nr:hypothetical protein [Halobiforma lacisalsi]APW98035.1 hypothetical protein CHINAEXTREME_09680 [Halobiforma lacisalsi AJ5]EMA28591.1 hypothetical protein C445_18241 [Halobiforma lacisalsi AJ5]